MSPQPHKALEATGQPQVHPGGPGSIQGVPVVTWTPHKVQPGDPGRSQVHPGHPRSIQELLAPSRTCPPRPGCDRGPSRSPQVHPGAPRSILVLPCSPVGVPAVSVAPWPPQGHSRVTVAVSPRARAQWPLLGHSVRVPKSRSSNVAAPGSPWPCPQSSTAAPGSPCPCPQELQLRGRSRATGSLELRGHLGAAPGSPCPRSQEPQLRGGRGRVPR